MFLAGTYVNDNDLLALAARLREYGRVECAEKFEAAYYRDVRFFELTPSDCDDLLVVLGGASQPALNRLCSALESVYAREASPAAA